MIELKNLEDKIRKLMENEDRKDTEFRYAITATEIGDLGKYITHDPKLNPNARPHGSKEDEILAYGQAFVQLAALAQLRGISLENAVEKGLENWIEADWRKSKDKGHFISGITACNGYAIGIAYVAKSEKDLKEMPPGRIVIAETAKPDLAQYLTSVLAIVTDHGGKTCHLANIAREYGTPCVVGTGNATRLIKTGDRIIVEAMTEEGHVWGE